MVQLNNPTSQALGDMGFKTSLLPMATGFKANPLSPPALKWAGQPITSGLGATKYAGSNAPTPGVSKWGVEEYDPYTNPNGYMQPGDVDAKWRPQPTPFGSAPSGDMGTVGNPTGNGWENVNRWNSQISAAVQRVSQMTGITVPANVVKAVMKLESGGENVGYNFAEYGGLMQVGAGSNVSDWDASYAATPEGNIYYGVQELANWYKAVGTGNWIDAAAAYFAGYNYNNYSIADGYGTTVGQYRQTIQNNLDQLQAAGGSTYTGGAYGQLGNSGTQFGGTLAGNNVVDIARKFVGVVPYVWGGIPGKGSVPGPNNGWDCSGFTYWLDQNYGTGQLPMGSHYQYQYAVQTGQLFTDMSQLQPGDLVFINTGWMGGAGSELNTAGHVGMYAGNGMMIHAANENVGTIISPLASYVAQNGFQILGGLHMSWSGGAGGGYNGGQTAQPTYQTAGNRAWGYLTGLTGGVSPTAGYTQTGFAPVRQSPPGLIQPVNRSATLGPATTPKPPQIISKPQAAEVALRPGTTTNTVIERLKTFVGMKYKLGAKVPGGANPLDYAQWDCSGLTKWLSDTYGNGQLPGGAHYQYKYAQDTGKLFTDLSQLQPGDILFIHGTFKGGAGAWLNDVSHVGIYLGNGQMISAAPGGTAIVPLDHYPSIGRPFRGAMHMPWSGGQDLLNGSRSR